ncbi:unnamed protein product [Parnassius apollo]|uniref:(apollo) hypothetical protein n=1 Tax=Parnassius apollo TaxID=110799 RepID=A0A8S3X859_PARAO|nr:unnamed protein product [Parnassius apollo]
MCVDNITDKLRIIFTDLPVVTLNLGANLDADKVVEGSDIYLDCRVRANPWYSNVHFTHNSLCGCTICLEKPSAVRNCNITNVTYDSLTLNCTPGHDGGVRQTFFLEVFDKTTGMLLRNINNEEPLFEVPGLSTSGILALSIRSYNSKGLSEAFTLACSLLQYPERRTAMSPKPKLKEMKLDSTKSTETETHKKKH